MGTTLTSRQGTKYSKVSSTRCLFFLPRSWCVVHILVLGENLEFQTALSTVLHLPVHCIYTALSLYEFCKSFFSSKLVIKRGWAILIYFSCCYFCVLPCRSFIIFSLKGLLLLQSGSTLYRRLLRCRVPPMLTFPGAACSAIATSRK